jgi:hypothetical protein
MLPSVSDARLEAFSEGFPTVPVPSGSVQRLRSSEPVRCGQPLVGVGCMLPMIQFMLALKHF